MTNFVLSILSILSMTACLAYCIKLTLKGEKEKIKMAVPIISLLVSIIGYIIPIYNSMDFSDTANFDLNKKVSLNSTIYAYPESFFTIRYTLDGSSPSKNSLLYTSDGIIVKKEDIQDNSFIISYQIGIGDMFYFPKTYTKEYVVSPTVELYPQKLSQPPEEIWVDNDKRIIFNKLTIDDQKGSINIIDGKLNTKSTFQPSITRPHTIIFSEPNHIGFSKIYLLQQDIRQINIIIDDKYSYICRFDDSDPKTDSLFKIDFMEKISVKSTLKFEIYSSNDYSISDIWFDYYMPQ